MKIKHILYTALLPVLAIFSSCIDDDINKDPNGLTDLNQTKPEWSLYASMSGAQMDPHIAERMFILTWKAAARFERPNSFALGSDNNGWMTDYLSINWGVGWLRDANRGVEFAQLKIDDGTANLVPYYKNMLEISRIWRVYVLSELTDGFGPIPLEGFAGKNVPFKSVEEIYKYMLTELADAENKLDPKIDMSPLKSKQELFYGGDIQKWKKYANSMRMRLAMRLSEVDPALAQKNFEEAAAKAYIDELGDIAQVTEFSGWNSFSGVMSRPWNKQPISTTYNNLVVGLGGQDFSVPDSLKTFMKDPKTYIGLKLDKHFPATTNDPCATYLFDGLPKTIDPRATKLFHIPGYFDNKGVFPTAAYDLEEALPSKKNKYKLNAKFILENGDAKADTLFIDMRYKWSACVSGEWDKKGSLSSNYTGNAYNFPSLSNAYRTSTNKRVFFGPWETYFLLAEAKHRGWNVKGTVQENYEKGIAASFDYHGLSSHYANYIASTDYNRVGTSVALTHTTEATNYTINYVDGYTKTPGTTTYEYPKNTIYNGGATNNDVLTKIITQKYIAQVPWLPLEAWSDHRRLGLPFMENQAVEKAYDTQTQVPLTPETSKDCDWKYYPKRYRYPATFQSNYAAGYQQAKQLLGGEDKSTTRLWWAK